jgi:hypothetical protein
MKKRGHISSPRLHILKLQGYHHIRSAECEKASAFNVSCVHAMTAANNDVKLLVGNHQASGELFCGNNRATNSAGCTIVAAWINADTGSAFLASGNQCATGTSDFPAPPESQHGPRCNG